MISHFLSFLLGALAVFFYNWVISTREFARRPLVLAGRNDGKNHFRLIPQHPFSFLLAAATNALYGHRLFGTDSFVTRFVQKVLRYKFNSYRRPASSVDDVVSFADSNGIPHTGWDKPIHKYESVDEFFTRRYAPERSTARNSTNNDDVLLSPSEGTVVGFPSLGVASDVWIKQKRCTLSTMGVPTEFLRSVGGGGDENGACHVLVFKLDVYDLHRYYAPVSGTIVARVDHLEPLRFSHSVRPVALKAGWDIMTENRRVVLVVETRSGDHVVMMVVGGIGVDSVDISLKEGDKVEQGDEVGMFHMGGSAILIAVSSENWKQRDDVLVASTLGVEVQTRIGDVVLERSPKSSQ